MLQKPWIGGFAPPKTQVWNEGKPLTPQVSYPVSFTGAFVHLFRCAFACQWQCIFTPCDILLGLQTLWRAFVSLRVNFLRLLAEHSIAPKMSLDRRINVAVDSCIHELNARTRSRFLSYCSNWLIRTPIWISVVHGRGIFVAHIAVYRHPPWNCWPLMFHEHHFHEV